MVIGFAEMVKGDIRSPDTVTVIGTFDGTIEASHIVIDGRAVASGTLVAQSVEILGTFTGDAFADHLLLADTCTVRGRIFHASLDLRQQAYFEGQSRRYTNPSDVYRQERHPAQGSNDDP